jgi:hypothetical protein
MNDAANAAFVANCTVNHRRTDRLEFLNDVRTAAQTVDVRPRVPLVSIARASALVIPQPGA